ncbi:TonB-dependent receptor [Methylomonas sp. AM2-LC]|uniref:TonB-dependent receptor n=1 Tax=Methylomonas sp. AM2-LC TaxID=3153301 RepID=UPI0032654F8A
MAKAEEEPSIATDEDITILEKVVVTGNKIVVPETSVKNEITQAEIASKQAQVSDTAKLLEDIPGVSLQSNGGTTSLPIIHGLNDDRIKIEVDGMLTPSACPNHMNPSLSYIDRTNIGNISVLKGVTPVSMGGDSIGGTIIVQSPTPIFAEAGKDFLINGKTSAFYRSNGVAYGGNIAAGIANQFVRLDYTGSDSESRDYRDGRGDVIKSSSYINQNHAVGLAFNFDNHLVEFKGGQQHVPFQGYPNARMEMLGNDSIFGNIHHLGNFSWGSLDSRLYLENISHSMDAGPDQLGAAVGPNMPMDTRAINFGYKVQAELQLNQQDNIKFGNEFHSQKLNDFWPGVCTACFDMGPNAFINLNNATRYRVGTYAEWNANWSTSWKSLLGLRYDHTMMDAGNVHGYNNFPFYANDANAFNAQSHQKNYDTFDVTALMKLTANDWSQYELGYARKNRAPSLYESYTWSSWSMATTMIGWFGDGNGYVGNLHLKPETAHNISFTAEYYDPKANDWSIKITPYLSYVENFIDADRCKLTFCFQPVNGYSYLQIANHNARLWGVDVASNAELFKDDTVGQFSTHSSMSYVRGQRMDGGNLYHMMPFNLKLSLDHKLADWKNTFEMQFVDAKQEVQAIRNELQTPSYIVLNAKTGYQWQNISIDVGVDNLLDKQYYYPLGGSYIGDYYTMMLNSTRFPNNRPVPSLGRSAFVGLTITY